MDLFGLNGAWVNGAQGTQYSTIFKTYPTIRICRDLIREYVFERDLIGPEGVSDPLWRQLGMDILDQVMVLGFAVVYAKPGELPAVVPFERCRIHISVDSTFKRIMTVYPQSLVEGDASTPMQHVYVLDVFGFSPSLDGSLNSLMRPLTYKIDMVMDQMDCAIAADRARARPPCFTETHADTTAPNQEVTYDYYADATSVQQNSMNTYMRNQSALEQLEAQQENLRVTGGRVDGSRRENVASHNVSTAVRNAIDSITPMPIGQRIARGPECHAPDNLVDRMRFVEQEIFVLLGVPRSFCMHDVTVRHDAGMLHCTMTRTVHRWQSSIAEALSFVWNVINNGPPKKKKYKPRAAALERMASIRFERMPRVSVAELDRAYQMGVVTWEAYKRNLGTFCGMDTEDLRSEGEPWTQEDRFQLLGHAKPLKTEFAKDANGDGI